MAPLCAVRARSLGPAVLSRTHGPGGDARMCAPPARCASATQRFLATTSNSNAAGTASAVDRRPTPRAAIRPRRPPCGSDAALDVGACVRGGVGRCGPSSVLRRTCGSRIPESCSCPPRLPGLRSYQTRRQPASPSRTAPLRAPDERMAPRRQPHMPDLGTSCASPAPPHHIAHFPPQLPPPLPL